MEEKEKSFEEKMNELEEVVNKISAGNLSLDETMKLYEKGKILIEELSAELKKAEEKVLKVVK
jgi:exodeoxyribonuclease VII small subunit